MELGGWTRLGIVVSVLYGIIVISVAASTLPKASSIYYSWIYDASEEIALAVSAKEGQEIQGYDVRSRALNKGDEKNIEWLHKAANSPTENQKIFSKEILEINKKYEEELSLLTSKQVEHWFLAFLWWSGGTAALFTFCFAIGWVYRGFKQARAQG